jgi:DNA-binding protein HU-beta
MFIMAKLNKKELVALVAEVKGSTKKDAEASIDAVVGAIMVALENGDTVSLSGFGTWEVRERDAYTGRNPQTGEAIAVPAKKTVVATVSPKVKELVNG